MGGPPGRAGAEGAWWGRRPVEARPRTLLGRRRGVLWLRVRGGSARAARRGRRERRWPAFRSLRPDPAASWTAGREAAARGSFPKAPLSRGGRGAGGGGRTDGRGKGAPRAHRGLGRGPVSPPSAHSVRVALWMHFAAQRGRAFCDPGKREEGRFVKPEFPSTRRTGVVIPRGEGAIAPTGVPAHRRRRCPCSQAPAPCPRGAVRPSLSGPGLPTGSQVRCGCVKRAQGVNSSFLWRCPPGSPAWGGGWIGPFWWLSEVRM